MALVRPSIHILRTRLFRRARESQQLVRRHHNNNSRSLLSITFDHHCTQNFCYSTTATTVTPTLIMSDASPPPPPPPPNVTLTWELSSDRPGHATVQLQPDNDDDEITTTTVAATTTTTTATTTIESSQSSSIPETVLQYERQVRKAQHAKKASAAVTADQLEVVYQDEYMVVVNKPPGVLTVPGIRHNECLLKLVHDMFAVDANGDGDDDDGVPVPTEPASMIVHRLDMDTSGLVMFGRTAAVTKLLHAAFRDRLVEKEYEAVLQGHMPATVNHAHINLSLQRDHAHPPFMRVATPVSEHQAQAVLLDLKAHGYKKLSKKRPKQSQTLVRVVERGMREFGVASTSDGEQQEQQQQQQQQSLPFTRVRLTPLTGRTHQLRVHCAALGYPIVGDPTYSLYGEAAPNGGLQNVPVAAVALQEGSSDDSLSLSLLDGRPSLDLQKAWTASHPPNIQPMCLHAAMLALKHPITGQDLKWQVPPAF